MTFERPIILGIGGDSFRKRRSRGLSIRFDARVLFGGLALRNELQKSGLLLADTNSSLWF